MEEQTNVNSSHQTFPPIHGHGGRFLLHGGQLEYVTGDADNEPNALAAGMTSEELDKHEGFSTSGFGGAECESGHPEFSRPAEHTEGHGGNFHLHGGHLEHVIGDADIRNPPAGMTTDELDKRDGFSPNGFGDDVGTPEFSRPEEHTKGHGGNFHLHGGHLEYVIGDDQTGSAAGMSSAELHKHDEFSPGGPATGATNGAGGSTEMSRPTEHTKGHGGNFHLHAGHLEHVIGDADIPNPPAAGMSTDELSELQ